MLEYLEIFYKHYHNFSKYGIIRIIRDENIVLFWGSNTGNKEEAASFLNEDMELGGIKVDEYNIVDTDLTKVLEFKKINNRLSYLACR